MKQRRWSGVLAACRGIGFFLLAVSTLALIPAKAVPAGSQQESALPPAREVIAKFIQAIGGREAILSIGSVRATGIFEVPAQGLRGDAELHAAKPDKVVMKINVAGLGELLEGFDGTVGWSLNPVTGPSLKEGKELEQARRDADFYRELHEEKDFKSIETVERTQFEGSDCYKLKLVTNTGDEYFEYFDVESGLLRGRVQDRVTQMGTVPVTEVVSDYKEFEGMRVPTKTVVRLLGQEQVLTITSFERGSFDDSVFALPEEIKALVQ